MFKHLFLFLLLNAFLGSSLFAQSSLTCDDTKESFPYSETFDEAVETSKKELTAWMAKRTTHVPDDIRLIFGPSLDGTYFFRMGDMGHDGDYGTYSDSFGTGILNIKNRLLDRGFTTRHFHEALLISVIENQGRAIGKPELKRCIKHFPGGDAMIEVTEQESLHISNPEQIKKDMIPFKLALSGDYKPECVMVGHPSFNKQGFDIEEEKVFLGPLIGEVDFDKIPAALNPKIIEFLRKQFNFDGLIYPDYLNMGAVFEFIDLIKKEKNLNLERELIMVYLASYSGVDVFLGHFVLGQFKDQMDSLPIEIKKDWKKTLLESAPDYLARVNSPDLDSPLREMSLIQLISLRNVYYSKLPYHSEIDGTDIWTRSGVLIHILRQLIVENLAELNGEEIANLPDLPNNVDLEDKWFDSLMKNNSFKKIYDQIPWGSAAVESHYCNSID